MKKLKKTFVASIFSICIFILFLMSSTSAEECCSEYWISESEGCSWGIEIGACECEEACYIERGSMAQTATNGAVLMK